MLREWLFLFPLLVAATAVRERKRGHSVDSDSGYENDPGRGQLGGPENAPTYENRNNGHDYMTLGGRSDGRGSEAWREYAHGSNRESALKDSGLLRPHDIYQELAGVFQPFDLDNIDDLDISRYLLRLQASADPARSDDVTVDIFNKTERFLKQMKYIESYLPQAKDDVDLEKYLTAVVAYNYLMFLKIFNEMQDEHGYDEAYKAALNNTKAHSNLTANQFAAPVRRVHSILQAIIAKPVEIVQTRCKPSTTDEWCNLYVLIETHHQSARCSNIWHHLKVFDETINTDFVISDNLLQSLRDKLNKSTNRGAKMNKNVLFESIITALRLSAYEEKPKLMKLSRLYNYIVFKQKRFKLNCININEFLEDSVV